MNENTVYFRANCIGFERKNAFKTLYLSIRIQNIY